MGSTTLETNYRFEAGPQIGGLVLANPNSVSTKEVRLRYDLTTQFAEIVDGSMRTEFDLKFNEHDLIGEDGSSLDRVTAVSLADAEKMAEVNPFLEFEERRRQHERDEFEELVDMARGNGPNVMVVVSDFPPELYSVDKDIGGYNVKRKQTMMRVMVRKPNGDIKMYSQSLDRSDRQGLEAIYEQLGRKPKPGELLGQRIRAEVADTRTDKLADELMEAYDRNLAKRFSGEWYAGRKPVDYRNTYEFVCRQTDLIDHCINMNGQGLLDNKYMYNIAATMQKRFDKGIGGATSTFTRNDIAGIAYEVIKAGRQAELQGKTFSGCGVTMSSTEFNGSFKGLFETAGFGNKAFCTYTSKECPKCQAKDVKTTSWEDELGVTHIEGECGCRA